MKGSHWHTTVSTPTRRQQRIADDADLMARRLKEALVPFPKQKGGPLIMVLGTGWGDTVKLGEEQCFSFNDFPFLRGLADLSGHNREICIGLLEGKVVIALRGRIHLNEEFTTPGVKRMWRTVFEALYLVGGRTLLTTAAVGGLGGRANKGDVILVDGFLAPAGLNPGTFTGEFYSADEVLRPALRRTVKRWTSENMPMLHVIEGGYAFWMGTLFEGKYNKREYSENPDLVCIGMSTWPEAAYWATKKRTRMLALGFATNSDFFKGKLVKHSHPENQSAAKQQKRELGRLLRGIVRNI